MKYILCVGLILMALCPTVVASEGLAPTALLKSKLDAIFAILQKKDLGQQEKNNQVIEIITPLFDFELMTKLSLGRKHWSDLLPEKKERLAQLFITRLRASYIKKLTDYTDEKVFYESPVQNKKKIFVPTYLTSKGNKISMWYKFYQSKNGWRIYDVEIQDVSIVKSYRSQFSRILHKGSVDDLILKMEASAHP